MIPNSTSLKPEICISTAFGITLLLKFNVYTNSTLLYPKIKLVMNSDCLD